MNMLKLGLAAAALALAAGEPARGEPVPRPAAVKVQDTDALAAAVQAWLAEVAAWGETYDAVTSSRADTLGRMMTEPVELIEMVESGDLAGARSWVAAWAPKTRRRLAADVETYRSLPTEMPAFPASVPMTPDHRARIEMMGQAPDRIGALLISTGQSAETYIQLVEAAASGDVDDIERLGIGSYTLVAAHLEAEIVMMEALRGEEGPVYEFRTAMIESNRAMIAWMLHEQAIGFGHDADPAAAAVAIRSHAAAARAAAIRMEQGIDVFERQTEADSAFQDTALAGLFDALFESMRESAEVEKRIAGQLDQLAAAVKADDVTAIDEAGLQIETLAVKRIELDAARRRMMAENGG